MNVKHLYVDGDLSSSLNWPCFLYKQCESELSEQMLAIHTSTHSTAPLIVQSITIISVSTVKKLRKLQPLLKQFTLIAAFY